MIAAGLLAWFTVSSFMAVTRGGGVIVRRLWLALIVLSAAIYFQHPGVTLG